MMLGDVLFTYSNMEMKMEDDLNSFFWVQIFKYRDESVFILYLNSNLEIYTQNIHFNYSLFPSPNLEI